MEPIDVANNAFQRVTFEVGQYLNSIETEADTRLKVIDRILTEVLLWPYRPISTEKPSASGYADYTLGIGGRSRLILEAKRDGRSLGCEQRQTKRGYKLSGGLFKAAAAKEGIDQAIRYCGEHSAELACVTNGREWIVFRGSRLGDGIATREGVAFVFPNLVAIEQSFAHFYNLLSYEACSTYGYRPYFQEAEGQPIRTSIFHKSLRAPGSAKYLPSGQLSADIDKIMVTYFQRLAGEDDPDMIEACFVESNESRQADAQLVRIADSIVSQIRGLDTGAGEALTQLISRVKQFGRHEFALIVGTKGAGKSTFVTRFFNQVLPDTLARHLVVVRIDLGTHSGDTSSIAQWLNAKLIDFMEADLFDGAPGFNEIQGMFFDEYTRLMKGNWAALYNSDKVAFQIRFGDYIETMRRDRPSDYIHGLVRHVVNSRLALPIIVFDNADHFDISFQQVVYQYARAIYEQAICVVILPITDRTSWQLSKAGALQSFEHESFFLPAPHTEDVIRKRIEFLSSRVELEREKPSDRYAISGNIYLSISDLAAFSRTLQQIFLQTSNVSHWIGNLANHDVRRTLALARSFITSPHLRVDDLVKAYLAGSAVVVPQSRAARALIRLHYDIFPAGQHDFVQDIFDLNSDLATTPLLGLRILQLLADAPSDERRAALLEVDEIVAYCAGMGIENRAVSLWLDALLKTGLALNYDPTISDISLAAQIEISPAGKQHLFWSINNYEYINAMADVTRLLSEGRFAEISARGRDGSGWHGKAATFIEYLLDEDALYCQPPRHDAYQGQHRLRGQLDVLHSKLEASSRRGRLSNSDRRQV